LAIERARHYGSSSNGSSNGTAAMSREDCLTEEEELQLVQRYCDQIRTTSDHFKWPVHVKVDLYAQPCPPHTLQKNADGTYH
jgi:cyclin H